jgi:hypothetical protein
LIPPWNHYTSPDSSETITCGKGRLTLGTLSPKLAPWLAPQHVRVEHLDIAESESISALRSLSLCTGPCTRPPVLWSHAGKAVRCNVGRHGLLRYITSLTLMPY